MKRPFKNKLITTYLILCILMSEKILGAVGGYGILAAMLCAVGFFVVFAIESGLNDTVWSREQ